MPNIHTFPGGIIIGGAAETAKKPTERLPGPEYVSIPAALCGGGECRAEVNAGDYVCKGQLIWSCDGDLSCPVYASVSGNVTEVIPGEKIVISSDGLEAADPSLEPFGKTLAETTPEDIIGTVKAAGIPGRRGSAAPAHVRISSMLGKAKRLIVNCTESDPFVCVVHRLMIEHPAEIINGAKILMKAFGLASAEIAADDGMPEAVNRLYETLGSSKLIRVRLVKAKYPQCDERLLIYALSGKVLPAGSRPEDAGIAVFDAETCADIFRTFVSGMPLCEKTVTVGGDCLAEPKNLTVPVGTPVGALIDFCGGFRKQPDRIVLGGLMNGTEADPAEAVVTPETDAVFAITKKYSGIKDNGACIRCGRCAAICPMHLMPLYLVRYAVAGKYAEAEKIGILNCTGCGACSYGCPGGVSIVQIIRAAKKAIEAKKVPADGEKQD